MDYLSNTAGDTKEWAEHKKIILLNAPTGSGKTWFALRVLHRDCIDSNSKMAIIVNRKILKEQVKSQEGDILLEWGRMVEQLKVFTYQELEADSEKAEKIMDYLTMCRYVVMDEAHYFVSDSRFNPNVMKSFLRLMSLVGKTCMIFLTATPKSIAELLGYYFEKKNGIEKKRWEESEKKREELKGRYVCEEYGIGDSLWDYAKLDHIIKSKEIDLEFPPVPEPQPLKYELIEGEKVNYDYMSVEFYSEDEWLVKKIENTPKCSKWLIFVNTKKEGRELAKSLPKEKSCCFIDAEYEKNSEAKAVVEEIVSTKKFSVNVLITTSVLDNGVTISDKTVENIAISAFTETEFIQMIGRRRVSDDEKLRLFVRTGSLTYFKELKRYYKKQFQEIRPLLGVANKECEKEGSLESIGLKEMHSIVDPPEIPNYIDVIKRCRISWEIVDSFLYEENGTFRWSWISGRRFFQDYSEILEIIEKIEGDPQAYEKLVCFWLGKDFAPERMIDGFVSDEARMKNIVAVIEKSPQFLAKDDFCTMAKEITKLAGKKESTDINTVNQILETFRENLKYQVKSFENDGRFYYVYNCEEGFPFKIDERFSSADAVYREIEKKGVGELPGLFEKIFGDKMPGLFTQSNKSSIKFFNYCMKKNEAVEEVSIRNRDGKMRRYRGGKKADGDNK